MTISKEIIICTKEELKRMFKLAHADGQNGFECDFEDYLGVLE